MALVTAAGDESEKRLRPSAAPPQGAPKERQSNREIEAQTTIPPPPWERRSAEAGGWERNYKPRSGGRKRLENRFIFHLLNTEDQYQPLQTGHVTVM